MSDYIQYWRVDKRIHFKGQILFSIQKKLNEGRGTREDVATFLKETNDIEALIKLTDDIPESEKPGMLKELDDIRIQFNKELKTCKLVD